MRTYKKNPEIVEIRGTLTRDVSINGSPPLTINSSAEQILELCDGNRSVPQIIETIQKISYGAPPEELSRSVVEMLQQLESLNLIVGVERDDDLSLTAARHKKLSMRLNPQCAQIFIAFGAFDRLGRGGLGYLGKTNIMNRNIMLINDPYGVYYQWGIDPVPNDFESVLNKIRANLEQVEGIKEIYTLGTSMGAYAAIAAGHALSVDGVFAFSGGTAYISDYMHMALLFRQTIIQFGGEYSDLRNLLKDYNGKTTYNLYYGRENYYDSLAADFLKPYEGIMLHPIDTDFHPVSHRLHEFGLDSVFPEFVGVD